MKITDKRSFKKHWLWLSMVCLLVLSWQCVFAGEPGFAICKKMSYKGKPSAPISISYSVPAQNSVGDSIPVTITIQVLSDFDSLKLEAIAEEGLRLLPSGPYERSYGSRPRNAALSETVTVIPSQEGRLYLNVFVTGVFNGKKMGHTRSIPLNVGTTSAKTLKKSNQVTTDSKGQKIVIMPAEEKTTEKTK